jgi:hypothetical protein
MISVALMPIASWRRSQGTPASGAGRFVPTACSRTTLAAAFAASQRARS